MVSKHNFDESNLIQQVVAEVEHGGVGGECGEGGQVSSGAVHPHRVTHLLP